MFTLMCDIFMCFRFVFVCSVFLVEFQHYCCFCGGGSGGGWRRRAAAAAAETSDLGFFRSRDFR
jgi:hypothetical protein